MNKNKRLVELQLHLENCDSIIFKSEEVRILSFNQVSKNYYVDSGSWHQYSNIDNVKIGLLINKDREHREFGIEEYVTTVSDVLKRNDITQITIKLQEDIKEGLVRDVSEHYHILWSDKEYDNMDYYNKNQITGWSIMNDKPFCRISINKENGEQ